MSKVFQEKQTFRMAWLDKNNPLPDLQLPPTAPEKLTWDESLTEEDARYFTYGHVNSILPYQFQDNYTQDKTEQRQTVVVLENAHIRAEFLPWMGGRLWSLKKDGRELLCHNPVVQPRNLALRNAWCSGGVEWNIGLRGHHMMTCSPMFTELLHLDDGTAGVRFFEFERLRGVAYRVEAYLPPQSEVLFVQMTIENPADNGVTPMYWWSNIAVNEGEGTRIVVPADGAIMTHYLEGSLHVSRVPVPMYEGIDGSFPVNLRHAIDFFYDIPKNHRKYIAALKHGTRGLVQFSTDRLLGRKLFVWGMNKGGRHWQEFLADEHTTYAEIQAGLAHTQNEHIPMPAGAVWSWLEGYGELNVDNVTDLPYPEAGARVTEALDKLCPQSALLEEQTDRAAKIAHAHGEMIVYGSGWGALENKRRAADNLPPLSEVCLFPDDSIGEAEKPWLALLSGDLPAADKNAAPESFMTSAAWLKRLEALENRDWNGWYQLGVARWKADNHDGAKDAFARSLALEDNAWAHDALADVAELENRKAEALTERRKALALRPEERALFLKYGNAALEAGLYQELYDAICRLTVIRDVPRVKALEVSALTGLERYDEARAILLAPLIVPDVREGELSMGQLWEQLHMKEHGITLEEAREKYPLPYALDFRMH